MSQPPPPDDVSPVAGLVVRDLTAAAGTFQLGPLSLDVLPGHVTVLEGPIGSGKSTLLEVLLGLRDPTGGSMTLGGRDLAREPVHRRGFGWLPQEVHLQPRRTVGEQLRHALAIAGRPGQWLGPPTLPEIAAQWRVDSLLRQPAATLSGGQAQLVGLLRALLSRPAALLLDEPLSAQHPEQRRWLRERLQTHLAATHLPTLWVTHSAAEADALATTRLRLVEGRLAEV